jgi:hypothetical protein
MPGEFVEQVGVPRRSRKELADHEQGPPLTDDGAGEGAAVRSFAEPVLDLS